MRAAPEWSPNARNITVFRAFEHEATRLPGSPPAAKSAGFIRF